MHTNFRLARCSTTSPASLARVHGEVSRRIGNIRAITLECRLANSDQTIGLARAIQELALPVLEQVWP
jgi:hypothetical protein